ncbi:unnamed protein product [Phyllotreta striolata]|uniref:Uncharacterized protein n=1 Tax=Phyllotreta striolata TaxID=444603 RepID=A0A9N9TLM9_PHYSR|nr:unnamed protein product [Phyllotreta striolata]
MVKLSLAISRISESTEMHFILFLIFFLRARSNAMCCYGPNNRSVDWFVIYKIPQLKDSNNLVETGLAYIYMTSHVQKWVYPDVSINDKATSMLWTTLSRLDSDKNYLFYNDEPPYVIGNPKPRGISKGVIGFTASGAFWLKHSVPHYPFVNIYDVPLSAAKTGHMFVCLSLKVDALDNLGRQFSNLNPNIYDSRISTSMKKSVPILYKSLNRLDLHRRPFINNEIFKTKKSVTVLSVAKSFKAKKELYSSVLTMYLKEHLYVEAFPTYGRRLEPRCYKKPRVANIQSVKIENPRVTFMSMDDSSSWALTNSTDSHWTCFGDLQQTDSHVQVSGGAICLDNENVHKNFQKLIVASLNCRHQFYYTRGRSKEVVDGE